MGEEKDVRSGKAREYGVEASSSSPVEQFLDTLSYPWPDQRVSPDTNLDNFDEWEPFYRRLGKSPSDPYSGSHKASSLILLPRIQTANMCDFKTDSSRYWPVSQCKERGVKSCRLVLCNPDEKRKERGDKTAGTV